MLKNLLKMNYKWWELVFFAGATAGAVVGSVAGIAAGFALGNLLAPKSGEDLRTDIANKTNELTEAVKEKGEELSKKVSRFYENLSSAGNGAHSETSVGSSKTNV